MVEQGGPHESWQDCLMVSDSGAPRSSVNTLRFFGAVLIAIAIFAGFLVTLGVRPDRNGVSIPTMDAVEQARQDMAVSVARMDDGVAGLVAANPDVVAYTESATALALYEDALGGVWVPWPDGAPEGRTNPPIDTAAPATFDDTALVNGLVELSDQALAASANATEQERGTYAAIALSARLTAQNVAIERGLEAPACPAGDALTAGAAAPDVTTLQAADTARQWLEVDAARLPSNDRDTELARIATVAAFEEAIVSAGADDLRETFAPMPAADDNPAGKALTLLTQQIVAASVIADQPGREALLGFSCSLFQDSAERSAVLPLVAHK